MKNNQFEHGTVNHIRIHVLPTDQFKTYAISLYIGKPLTEETVTPIALVPFILRRGTQRWPETQQFREHLDDLYGAGFGFDIYKRGNNQIVQFRMDVIQDQFVSDSTSLLKESLEFMGDVMVHPALEEGHFVQKYVDAEKNTVQKKLEAIINDKIKYAAERCIQEMFKNEPFRLNALGKLAEIPQMTASSLYSQYVQWIHSAPIDLYVVGNTTLAEVEFLVQDSFRFDRNKHGESYHVQTNKESVSDVKTVVEKMDVNQGKLNMGLRTNITYADPHYPAALMYNGILGAYPHSKLFANVREKESLAYYASSRLDGHKGILTIQSGIEIKNYTKAVDIIREQLEAIKNGTISDLELSQTQAMIVNQLEEIQDSAFEMISFDFNRILSGHDPSLPGLIKAIEHVDRSSIQQVAAQAELDTIYFLRDQKGD
ncbi:MAG TPA: pitrilysin family protein [Bacilli bacterium]